MIVSSGHLVVFLVWKFDDVIEMCDIKTGEWKTLNVKMTFPRVNSKAVVVNDKIWINWWNVINT